MQKMFYLFTCHPKVFSIDGNSLGTVPGGLHVCKMGPGVRHQVILETLPKGNVTHNGPSIAGYRDQLGFCQIPWKRGWDTEQIICGGKQAQGVRHQVQGMSGVPKGE